MRRTGWRLLLGSVATPFVAAAVLVGEWKLAKRGPQLESTDFPEGGRIGEGEPALRLVWLGDSLVTGAGVSSADAAVPRVVARTLGEPVELVILAVSGSGVRRVVDDQLPRLAGVDADAVVVCIGTNDVLYHTRLDEVREACRAIFRAVPPGVPVVVVGPVDWGAVPRLAQPLRAVLGVVGRRIARAMREEVTAAGGTFVDLGEAIGPAIRRDPGRLLARDLFHPSDAGAELAADAIARALRPALEASRRPSEAVPDAGR